MMDAGPSDIRILQDLDLPSLVEPQDTMPQDSVMYSYRQSGLINGIPVSLGARDLLVSNLLLLFTALVYGRTVHTFMRWVSPDTPLLLLLLNLIRQRLANGSLIIKLLSKQYSLARGAFLIMLTYETLLYELNPRFAYLKQ